MKRSRWSPFAWACGVITACGGADAWATTCYAPETCVCYGGVILETVIGTISEVRPANGGNVVIVSVESGARRDGPPISSGALVDIGTGGAVGTRVIAFRSSGGWIDAPSIAPDGTFECFSATTRQRRVDAASALQIAVDPNCNDRARRELGLTQSTCPLACAVPQGAVLPATAAAVVALILLQRRRATRRKQAG